MIKVSYYKGYDEERGPQVIPLFSPADSIFEKVAAPGLLPGLLKYIETLKPENGYQYVLVNAMAAGEYFGANSNSDYFSEQSLTHAPEGWMDDPIFDRELAKNWTYGFPTFYGAGAFAHHRNKDHSKAFGTVEYTGWNPRMKRVELVIKVSEELCKKFGNTAVWDRLANGQFVDVSMGTRVGFDLCSICTDWKLYREAQATFDPMIHAHEGIAILQFHKKLIARFGEGHGIRGLAPTRKFYCEHMRQMPGRILPDGRRVFVFNPHPRFFDISFVFIGADRTAKVMIKIADSNRVYSFPGALLAESLGYIDNDSDEYAKVAGIWVPKQAMLGKSSGNKKAEIVKDVVPDQLAAKAIPILTRNEEALPNNLLDVIGKRGLGPALATTTSMGMVLKPTEFQRLMLKSMGEDTLADTLDSMGHVFPKVPETTDMPIDMKETSPLLARLLAPFMAMRSAYGPHINGRIVVVSIDRGSPKKQIASQDSPTLRKIAAAYNGYRNSMIDMLPEAQSVVASDGMPGDIAKVASVPLEELFTPLSYRYLKDAYWDELKTAQACATVERGCPSRNTGALENVSRRIS